MSKHQCEVIGHRKIRPRRGKDAPAMMRIELTGQDGLTAQFPVALNEAGKYPIGCEATFNFSIQQSLPLPTGDGGRTVAVLPHELAAAH